MEKKTTEQDCLSAVFNNRTHLLIKAQLIFLYFLAFFILMNLYFTSQNIKSVATMTEHVKQQMKIFEDRAKIPEMQIQMHLPIRYEENSYIEDLKYETFARKNGTIPSNYIKTTDVEYLGANEESEIEFTIDNYEICAENLGESGSFDILILIESSHNNTRQRDALRKTWLTHAKNNTAKKIRYVFVLETSSSVLVNQMILNESLINRDIIQGDVSDLNTYAITKARIALEWAGRRCPDAKFVLKMNDGVYASISNLIQMVNKYEERLENSIGVSCTSYFKPPPQQKIDLELNRKSNCVYSTFITSASVIIQMINIPDMSWNFKNDAELIAFCKHKLDLVEIHIAAFITKTLERKLCHKSFKTYALHSNVSTIDMYTMWNLKC